MRSFTINYSVSILPERVNDLLCCAFEGGSTYWCERAEIVEPVKESYEYLHEIPMAGGSLRLTVSDEEGSLSREAAILDANRCEEGLNLMATLYSNHFDTFMRENEDAVTGDVFLQLCLFGDVVFS